MSSMPETILQKSNHSYMQMCCTDFDTCFLANLSSIFSCGSFSVVKIIYIVINAGRFLLDLAVCFSLITGCCYKFLENPATVKNGTTKDLVFNLMGVMVKEYNYGLGESYFFVGH